ncbi:MAG: peptidoglycan synthetase [Candidatus Arcticimaribacter sp.]|nr:MAG: peptidoglycan synthetase [Candidatus Arcticimaribacter sp.]
MKKFHFIAIGGSAMHNLALALQFKGFEISGSDDAIFEPSKSRLAKADLLPEVMGWYPEKIADDLDGIILGMHAKEDNPELLKAMELGIRIYSYPEFLYEQTKNKTRVVIAGSHGKTTITSMVLHVLNYWEKEVDYMIGAQLEGFDTMVHLTEENDFMLIEGDEYLSSPIDRRPKFLWYKPHVTLISGIAWDHINVFPTEENYIEQFETYIDSIMPGGVLVYNESDSVLERITEASQNTIRKESYRLPEYFIDTGVTYLKTDEGDLPLEVFGEHNLSNIAGAKWICQLMGVDEDDFLEAIMSFKGASKRLEKIGDNGSSFLFKDFAHAPSKVKATSEAVAQQFDKHHKVYCLELHTYSSLNPAFIGQYKNALIGADEAVVFYDPEALKVKNRSPLSEEEIKTAFGSENLIVFTNPKAFQEFLFEHQWNKSILLMMSSGNYGGIDWDTLKERVLSL